MFASFVANGGNGKLIFTYLVTFFNTPLCYKFIIFVLVVLLSTLILSQHVLKEQNINIKINHKLKEQYDYKHL